MLPNIPITYTCVAVVLVVVAVLLLIKKRNLMGIFLAAITMIALVVSHQVFCHIVYSNTGLENQEGVLFTTLNEYYNMVQDDSDELEEILGMDGAQYLIFFRYDCEDCHEFFEEYGGMLKEKDNVWFINSRSANGAELVDEVKVYSVPSIYCYEDGEFTKLALYDDNDEIDPSVLEGLS